MVKGNLSQHLEGLSMNTLTHSKLHSTPATIPPQLPYAICHPSIRQCRESDAAEIYEIISDKTEPFRFEQSNIPPLPFDKIKTSLECNPSAWAFESRNTLYGVIMIKQTPAGHFISYIAVRPFRRGLGIGGKLLRHAERACGLSLLVCLDKSAVWSMRFFEKYHYRRTSNESICAAAKNFSGIPQNKWRHYCVLTRQSGNRNRQQVDQTKRIGKG
jgi:GNAT superfamily N-acetyltransferase